MLSVIDHGRGYQKYTLQELNRVDVTPKGKRSDRWQGIQHGELVKGLQKTLGTLFDAQPTNEQYLVSPNEAVLIGGFELQRHGKPIELSPGVGASIGFVHANDSSRSLTVLAGGRVFLCSNGAIVGEIKFQRKHTSGLHLGDWLESNLERFLPDLKRTFEERMIPLHNTKVNRPKHDKLLLELTRNDIVPWRLGGDLDRIWERAASGEGLDWVAESDQDAWGFKGTKWDYYGAVSHVIKQLSPNGQIRSLSEALTLVSAA